MSQQKAITTQEEAKSAEEKQRRKAERLLNDFKRVLSMPEGERVLWWLLEQTHIFHSCFTGNSNTFYKEGRRDAGLMVLEKINMADSKAFARMQERYFQEIREDETNG